MPLDPADEPALTEHARLWRQIDRLRGLLDLERPDTPQAEALRSQIKAVEDALFANGQRFGSKR